MWNKSLSCALVRWGGILKIGATRVAFRMCLKKKETGTLFGTVGVVEWSYGKFGEFVVEWMRSISRYNSTKICVSGWILLLEDICVMNEEMMAGEIK